LNMMMMIINDVDDTMMMMKARRREKKPPANWAKLHSESICYDSLQFFSVVQFRISKSRVWHLAPGLKRRIALSKYGLVVAVCSARILAPAGRRHVTPTIADSVVFIFSRIVTETAAAA